jgi:uncharacterized protein involved in tellurium resistance
METGTIIRVKSEGNCGVVKIDGQNFGAVVNNPSFTLKTGDRLEFTIEIENFSIVAKNLSVIKQHK